MSAITMVDYIVMMMMIMIIGLNEQDRIRKAEKIFSHQTHKTVTIVAF